MMKQKMKKLSEKEIEKANMADTVEENMSSEEL